MDKQKIAQNIYKQFDCLHAHKMVHFKDDELKGIFIILRLLRIQDKEMLAGEIAKNLAVSTARVAVALKTLENKKYIIKYKPKHDGRQTIAKITEQGIFALQEREKNIVMMIQRHLEKLSDEETLQFQNILTKLLA